MTKFCGDCYTMKKSKSGSKVKGYWICRSCFLKNKELEEKIKETLIKEKNLFIKDVKSKR